MTTPDYAQSVLADYLRSLGLYNTPDAATQYSMTLLRQWISHFEFMLYRHPEITPQLRRQLITEMIYGAVTLDAEAGLRAKMQQDMSQTISEMKSPGG